MRDSYTSITRLPEKSAEYGLMHVMAVKIVKTAILFLLMLKAQDLIQWDFFFSINFQYHVLEHLSC